MSLLYSDLTAKVFKARDLEEISHVRTILDLVNLLKKIRLSSPAMVAAPKHQVFLDPLNSLTQQCT